MPLTAAFIAVILIWSTTPLAIKWSALGLGFSFAVLGRMALGTALCALLLALLRVRLPVHRKARLAYTVGGLSIFGTMALTYWASQYVSSGLISVLFGLTPLITSMAAGLWLKEDALTRARLAGMLLGVAGLALVFADSFRMGAGAALGLLALLAAVTSQSFGLVLLKRIGDDSPPLATTLGSLAVSLPFFSAAWWLADGHVPHAVPLRAEAAMVYLGVVASALGFMLYFHLVRHVQASRIALVTLITPVAALMLGHVLNHESVLPQVWAGAALILSGLLLHQWGERLLPARGK